MSRKLASIFDFNNRIKKDNQQICNKHRKALLSDVQIPVLTKISFFKKNTTKYHNYCLITGRTKGIYNKYKISRMSLKYAIYHGYINGVTKYSW